jgi:hypothetical protein
MRREKVRLEELRSMAYEEYLHTPEWQETREAALKRAGNRCQVCRAEDVALDVYHTTYETLGCEQESDVIALCEACYDLLSQRQKLMPNDNTAETTGDEPAYPHFSFSQRALVFTPSALVGVGLPAFLHAPLPAELFGLGAAIALAVNSPKIYAEIRDSLPAPLVAFLDGQAARKRSRAATGEWSKWDRLLGRHLRDYAPDQDAESSAPDDKDTVVVDEADLDREIEDQEEVQEPPSSSRADLGTIMIRAKDPEREILLAENLGLDIDEVIEAGVFVAGMKGSGKSELAAHLMEQLGRFPLSQIVYCLKGDFTSLVASHFTNGLVMTRQHLYDARTILSCRLQVVVDLRSWETMEERAQVIASLNQALLKHAMSLPEQLRIPWFVHLDEAQQFVSQQKPVGIELSTWKWVTQSVTNLGILGRSFGAVPCLYTQRIADIHKDVISQQEFRVFMKAALDNDLKRYEEYISAKTARREDIQTFRAGDAVVILPNGRQFITHFLRRESKHGSHTPHLTQALLLRHEHLHLSHAEAASSGTSAPGSIAVATEQASGFTFPPSVLPARPASTSASPTGGFTAAIPVLLRRAQELYRPGMTYRDLGAELGYGDAEAREIWLELRRRGLLHAAPQPAERATTRQEARQPWHKQDEQQPAPTPILNLPDYQQKPEQRIPALQEVIDAFPNQLPSKRVIAKRFRITDHQAYKLYQQLEKLVGRSGGRLDEASERRN